MTCDCNCNCPNLGEDCDCDCGCPLQANGPYLGDGCAQGYTRICPRRGLFCPDDMIDLCPKDIIGHLLKDNDESPTELTGRKETKGWMISKTEKKIKLSGTTFTCIISLSHTYNTVRLPQSEIKCSPSSPKNQKALQWEFSVKGYTFKINADINPTKLSSARVIGFPATTTTTTSTTSTTTTSTTTTLFDYNGCTCLPDFVLYFSHQAISYNTGLANRAGQFFVPWKTAPKKEGGLDRSFAGPYNHSFTIPVKTSSRLLQRTETRQAGMFLSSCYCVQREGISITGVIMK